MLARTGSREVAGQAENDMHRTIVFALLAQCLLLALAPRAAAAAAQKPALPDVRSQAYYVVDGSDSSVLASRHENTPAPIASITKLMTALVILEAGQPMDEKVTITAEKAKRA